MTTTPKYGWPFVCNWRLYSVVVLCGLGSCGSYCQTTDGCALPGQLLFSSGRFGIQILSRAGEANLIYGRGIRGFTFTAFGGEDSILAAEFGVLEFEAGGSGRPKRSYEIPECRGNRQLGVVADVVVLGDMVFAACSGPGTIVAFDPVTGIRSQGFACCGGGVRDFTTARLRVSSRGDLILLTTTEVARLDPQTGVKLETLLPFDGAQGFVDLALRDDQTLFLATRGRGVFMVRIPEFVEITQIVPQDSDLLNEKEITALSVSPHGRLVLALDDGQILEVDTDRGTHHILRGSSGRDDVLAMAFRPQ